MKIDNELKNIYRFGFENMKSIYPDYKEKGKSKKTILYYIVATFISPQLTVPNEIYFINGKAERNNGVECSIKDKVYRGNWFHTISEIKKEYILTSPISFMKRISIWMYAILSYRPEYGGFGIWLDYLFLINFIKTVNIKKCISRGHYDDFTTWIGNLSRIYRFEYEMYQHGVISESILVPNKIYCNKVNVFDSYSQSVFRKNYIDNDSCKYIVYPFHSSVEFDEIERKEGIYYIGLIEQKNPSWVDNIISELRKFTREYEVIIMKHPLSTINYSYPNTKVTTKKYSNFDLIVVSDSTLVIDYYRAKIEVPIIATNLSMKKPLEMYVRYWISSPEELSPLILQVLEDV